jgi:hypothetical protein
MKIFTWTNLAIFILFVSLIGLAFYTINKPSENFEQKSPEEAYLNWVSHTEYIAGDTTGQGIISVSDYKGRPLNASCLLSLVYPDNTFVFTDYAMSPSIIAGNYYRIFTVPNTFGVYTEFVNCSVQLNPAINVSGSKSNSIHVNPAFDFLVNISQNITDLKQEFVNFTVDVQNNFTYTNWLISQVNESINISADLNYTNQLIMNVSTNVTNFRNEAYTWYIDIISRIYNCCERWIEEIGKLGTLGGNVIQRLPTGGGTSQTNMPSWLKRIIGGD